MPGVGEGGANNIAGKRGQVSRHLQLMIPLKPSRTLWELLGMEALLSLVSYLKRVNTASGPSLSSKGVDLNSCSQGKNS